MLKIINNRPIYELIRSDTWIIDITQKNEDGTPINITGCVFKFTVKEDYDTNPIITQESVGVDIFRNDLQGIIIYTVNTILTKTLKIKRYLWDVERTDTQGKKKTILIGDLIIGREVSANSS